MALWMRSAEQAGIDRNSRPLSTLVVALIRRGKVLPLGGRAISITTGDMLVYIRDKVTSVVSLSA
jgi:voltage-gated potassium channel